MNFLERTDEVKQTIALEYMYGRRTRGNVGWSSLRFWSVLFRLKILLIYGNWVEARIWHLYWQFLWRLLTSSMLDYPKIYKCIWAKYDFSVASVIVFLDLTKLDSLWQTMEVRMKSNLHNETQNTGDNRICEENARFVDERWRGFETKNCQGHENENGEIWGRCEVVCTFPYSDHDYRRKIRRVSSAEYANLSNLTQSNSSELWFW